MQDVLHVQPLVADGHAAPADLDDGGSVGGQRGDVRVVVVVERLVKVGLHGRREFHVEVVTGPEPGHGVVHLDVLVVREGPHDEGGHPPWWWRSPGRRWRSKRRR